MSRRSIASLNVVPLVRTERPGAPATLTPEQCQVWHSVVASKPADWFQADSLPILEAYCKAVDAHRVVAAHLDAFDPAWLSEDDGLRRFDKLTQIAARHASLMAALATKMRLTQQSRYGARHAETQDRQARGIRPWQREGIEIANG